MNACIKTFLSRFTLCSLFIFGVNGPFLFSLAASQDTPTDSRNLDPIPEILKLQHQAAELESKLLSMQPNFEAFMESLRGDNPLIDYPLFDALEIQLKRPYIYIASLVYGIVGAELIAVVHNIANLNLPMSQRYKIGAAGALFGVAAGIRKTLKRDPPKDVSIRAFINRYRKFLHSKGISLPNREPNSNDIAQLDWFGPNYIQYLARLRHMTEVLATTNQRALSMHLKEIQSYLVSARKSLAKYQRTLASLRSSDPYDSQNAVLVEAATVFVDSFVLAEIKSALSSLHEAATSGMAHTVVNKVEINDVTNYESLWSAFKAELNVVNNRLSTYPEVQGGARPTKFHWAVKALGKYALFSAPGNLFVGYLASQSPSPDLGPLILLGAYNAYVLGAAIYDSYKISKQTTDGAELEAAKAYVESSIKNLSIEQTNLMPLPPDQALVAQLAFEDLGGDSKQIEKIIRVIAQIKSDGPDVHRMYRRPSRIHYLALSNALNAAAIILGQHGKARSSLNGASIDFCKKVLKTLSSGSAIPKPTL